MFQDYAIQFYGSLPLNQSQSRPRRQRDSIATFPNRIGEPVLFRARVQATRGQGSKMAFLNLRQMTDTVQGLLIVTSDKVSKQMVKWATSLAVESVVLVEGIAQEVQDPIKSTTISNVEVHISQVPIMASFSTPFLNTFTAPPDSWTRVPPPFYGRGCQPSGNRV